MTVEESIQHLLSESEKHLMRAGMKLNQVGNHPRFPMFILWNASFPGPAFAENGSITVGIRSIWPQAVRHLAHFAYEFQDGESFQFLSLPERKPVDEAAVLAALSSEQRSRDVFTGMEQWRVYHVVDTSDIQSVEEFERHYRAVYKFRSILSDSEKTMLLVLLDESRSGRLLASEIRKFLSVYSKPEKSLYASTILISNVRRDNHGCDMEELYRIITGILTLSNNDMFSSSESARFYQSVSTLYNKNTFTVSYQRLERPNRDIALQIHQTILDRAVETVSHTLPQDDRTWNGFLTDNSQNAQSGRNRICEEIARKWPVKIDREIFEHLPLRTASRDAVGNMSNIPFARMKRTTFPGILNYLAEEYSKSQIDSNESPEAVSRRADDMAERWKQETLRRKPLWVFRDLTDAQISGMTAELTVGRPPEDETALRYFEDCVRIQLRKRVLYPRLKRALTELRNQARDADRQLRLLRDVYRQMLPPRGFRYLGPEYKDAATDFLDTPVGRTYLRQICTADGGISGILHCMETAFQKLVEQKQVLFSLSFMDEWMQRLRFEEDRMFRTISDELTGMEDNLFHLRGNYPVSDKKLRIFLLHTADMDGKNTTALYENLKITFNQEPVPQYLNTGYDGSMEAFTFVCCNGLDLI